MAMPRHESVFQNQQQYDVGKISHTHMDTCTFLNYSVKVCISQSVTVLLVKFFFFCFMVLLHEFSIQSGINTGIKWK